MIHSKRLSQSSLGLFSAGKKPDVLAAQQGLLSKKHALRERLNRLLKKRQEGASNSRLSGQIKKAFNQLRTIEDRLKVAKEGLDALLVFAIHSGNSAAESFLAQGADSNFILEADPEEGMQMSTNIFSLLFIAAGNGDTRNVRALLKYGAKVDFESVYGTALMAAAEKGHVNTLKVLVEYGAALNIQNQRDGMSALMVAAQNGHCEAVEFLFSKGGDINQRDREGFTPLILATKYCESPDMIRLLLRLGAPVDSHDRNGSTPLLFAAKAGNWENLKLLLENGAFPSPRESNGWTPLMIAAYRKAKGAVSTLLGHQADINLQEEDGWTALHLAGQHNDKAIVDLLLEQGADPNRKAYDETTPLMIATVAGHVEIVKTLVQAGADIHARHKKNYLSVLTLARYTRHDAIYLFLKNLGACEPYSANTCLIASIKRGSLIDVKEALAAGADIDGRDWSGHTPLMMAVQANSEPIVAYLIDQGAQVNLFFKPSKACFDKQHDHFSSFTRVSKTQEHDTSLSRQAYTALDIAIRIGNAAIVEQLVDAGADFQLNLEDVDIKDEKEKQDEKAKQKVYSYIVSALMSTFFDRQHLVPILEKAFNRSLSRSSQTDSIRQDYTTTLSRVTELVQRVSTIRKEQGVEPDPDLDHRVLNAMLDLIDATLKVSKEDSRGNSKRLYLIFNLAKSLSCPLAIDRIPKPCIRKKNNDAGNTILRDLIFFAQMIKPESLPEAGRCAKHWFNFPIPDAVCTKILNEELPALQTFIREELGHVADAPSFSRNRYAYATWFDRMPTFMAHVWHYRDYISLTTILEHTDPSQYARLDPNIRSDQLAILRRLCIVGENLARANLSQRSRSLLCYDPQPLITLRNRLSHYEWQLSHRQTLNQICTSAAGFQGLLEQDIPAIHNDIKRLFINDHDQWPLPELVPTNLGLLLARYQPATFTRNHTPSATGYPHVTTLLERLCHSPSAESTSSAQTSATLHEIGQTLDQARHLLENINITESDLLNTYRISQNQYKFIHPEHFKAPVDPVGFQTAVSSMGDYVNVVLERQARRIICQAHRQEYNRDQHLLRDTDVPILKSETKNTYDYLKGMALYLEGIKAGMMLARNPQTTLALEQLLLTIPPLLSQLPDTISRQISNAFSTRGWVLFRNFLAHQNPYQLATKSILSESSYLTLLSILLHNIRPLVHQFEMTALPKCPALPSAGTTQPPTEAGELKNTSRETPLFNADTKEIEKGEGYGAWRSFLIPLLVLILIYVLERQLNSDNA